MTSPTPSNPQQIADAARELSPEPRDVYVRSACGNDDALRPDVDALLAAQSDDRDGMADTVVVSPSRPAPVSDADETLVVAARAAQQAHSPRDLFVAIPVENAGQRFDFVWLAQQNEPVRRAVALKIIKLGMDTKQVVTRFEAEGQALAMMDHPNIARVFDAGSTDNGRPFFVMELVKGVPILEYCDST